MRRTELYPFEMVAHPGCDSDPLHFTGQHHDAMTGLDLFPARAYGHTAAAFMSPDPAGFAAADLENPQSLNVYGYVNGNPVTFNDLDGHVCCGLGAIWDYISSAGGATAGAAGNMFATPPVAPPPAPCVLGPALFCASASPHMPPPAPPPDLAGVLVLPYREAYAGVAAAAGTAWPNFKGSFSPGHCSIEIPCAGTVFPEGELGEGAEALDAAEGVEADEAMLATQHGAEQLADASRLNPGEAAEAEANATQTLTQSDGAKVLVQETGGGRYNVVVRNPSTGRLITNPLSLAKYSATPRRSGVRLFPKKSRTRPTPDRHLNLRDSIKSIDARALATLARNYGWH